MRSEDTAALVFAARRVKQARDACRTAARRIAEAQRDADVYASRTCATPRDVQEVAALAALAVSEHGRVEVVVLVTAENDSFHGLGDGAQEEAS